MNDPGGPFAPVKLKETCSHEKHLVEIAGEMPTVLVLKQFIYLMDQPNPTTGTYRAALIMFNELARRDESITKRRDVMEFMELIDRAASVTENKTKEDR